MAGERKKPTAAEKGKAIAVEEKKKDKGMEAALNAVHAAERRRPGIVIEEPPATAAESPVPRRSERNRMAPTRNDARGTPGSRKRARSDNVEPGRRATPDIVPPPPPPPHPIMDGDGLFSKASRSVVTVVFDMDNGDASVTSYRTGFILLDEENYCLVLTTSKLIATAKGITYFVHFGGEKLRTQAHGLQIFNENHLLLLIVETNKRHEPVKFSRDPLGYEVIFTVYATSDTKLNDKANAPRVEELEGSLGFYKGTVGTPSCHSLDADCKQIAGSEKYFQLGLSLHDDIITFKNVDADKHTAETAESAPVFRLDGEIAGMIFSEGGWSDSKIGLLGKHIILCLETNFANWEEDLKKLAEKWLKQRKLVGARTKLKVCAFVSF